MMTYGLEYILVEEESKFILEDVVNEKIGDGWKPLGGVAINSVPRPGLVKVVYVQAMTRSIQDD